MVLAQVSVILYVETHNKRFKTSYLVLKTIGTFFKIYWDFVVDWGLFSGTRPETKWLRDQKVFTPCLYYVCMVLDVFGLFFWVIVYKWVDSLTPAGKLDHIVYYNSVNKIVWLEMIVLAVRRTIWILIRLENEFFYNVEQYRDILTIPPISKNNWAIKMIYKYSFRYHGKVWWLFEFSNHFLSNETAQKN